jgi:Fe2+ transport system protein FeoA
MQNSELATQVSASVPTIDVRLDRAPIGRATILLGFADDDRADPDARSALVDQLAADGLVEGALLTPERRLPLGGPVIVAMGGARLALGRDIARQLVVRDTADGRGAGSGPGPNADP